ASVAAQVPDDATLLAFPYDSGLAPALDVDLPVPVAGLLAHYEAEGKAGEVVEVPVVRGGDVGRVLLYGVGDASPRSLRKAAATLPASPYDSGLAPAPDVDLPGPVAGLLAHYEAEGKAGEVVEVPVVRGGDVGRVLLYGVGDASPRSLRKAAATLTRRVRGRESLAVVTPEGDMSVFTEAALLAAYSYKIGSPGKRPVGALTFVGADEEQVRRGEQVARAVAL